MTLVHSGASAVIPTEQAEPAVVAIDDLYAAYETWPDDIRRKLSYHDLRRMSGWKPKGELNIQPSPEAVAKIDKLMRGGINTEIGRVVVGHQPADGCSGNEGAGQ